MTNDIRRNIMLIESIILDESFKDAQTKFSTFTSPQEAKEYIDKFKELSKKNIIKGQEKDIGYWIKGDWDSFKKFVDSNKEVTTKRQTKVEQKKDSIRVYQDEEKQVVIPLTKEASIQYGKNTKWCTAAIESKNFFVDYFYANKITLFYVLFKDGVKYACAFHPDKPDTIECFDQQDKSMDFYEFQEATGVSKKDIQNWFNSNRAKIEDSRNLNKSSEEAQLAAVKQDGSAIMYIDNPSEEVQLAAVKQSVLAIRHISNPTEKVQLVTVNKDGSAIRYIDNPTEKVQLVSVNKDGSAIRHIIEKGIEPSEEVKLSAVSQSKFAIEYIDKPSEEVQLAAVNKSGYTIRDIYEKGIVPSEAVQLAAVSNDGYAIEGIDNPTEKVQLAAVNQDNSAIECIDKPTEKVQLAAVNKYDYAIMHIIEKGIEPSEEVQLAAVNKSGHAIRYIKNPSEKVKALYNKLYK